MDIRKKEGIGLNISVKLDKNNYDSFIKDIKKLGKKYETKSNVNKLDYSILTNCQKLPYMKVVGWASRVLDKNGKVSEVFFCDYDNVLFRIVEDELNYLQEQYNLPPFYVFCTFEEKDANGEVYGNYLIVNLKKNTFKEVVDMQDQLHCDQAYKKIPLIYRFRTWVLRLFGKGKRPKPVFKCIIGDIKREYHQACSKGHLDALNSMYKLPKIKYKNLDNNSKIFLAEYVTASS